jgi:hypothetical protein
MQSNPPSSPFSKREKQNLLAKPFKKPILPLKREAGRDFHRCLSKR